MLRPTTILLLALFYATAAAAQYLRQSADEAEHPTVSQIYPAHHPFLLDSGPAFASYAHTPFTNYDDAVPPYTSSRRTYYGPLGDRLISGFDVAWWQENRSAEQGSDSWIFKSDNRYYSIFDRVMVASDAAAGWSGRAIFGNEIRTMFTPLTFYWAGLNGLRLDWMAERTQISVIGSRVSRPGYPHGPFREHDGEEFRDLNPVYILGGHAEHALGLLHLGTTYVNIHSTNVDQGKEELRGSLPISRDPADILAIKIADESPEDGRGGPVVFDMAVWVNGERRDDLRPEVVRHRTVRTAVGRISAGTGRFSPNAYASRFYTTANPNEAHRGFLFRVADQPLEIPLFADYFYLQDHLSGTDVSKRVSVPLLTANVELLPPDEVHRADGDDFLLYYLDMRDVEAVDSVELGFLLGNDYQIGLSELHQQGGRRDPYERQFTAEIIRVVARAPGNVQDLSNVRWVKVKYGAPTGLSLYSVNANMNFLGLDIAGEWATSVEHNQYPNPGLDGARHDKRARAWYLVATKYAERWGVGGEIFSMNPAYKTSMFAHIPQDFETYNEWGFANNTGIYHLVQDNDDHDRFPDVWLGMVLGDVFAGEEDPDGVFLGKDEDHDGLPDTNRNYNTLPDYVEPFLMFDVESDDYVYGADMNNNDVPDYREDDLDPEYPYDLDLQGGHLLGWAEPLRHLRLTLGRLHSEQVAGGRRNRMVYGRASYRGAAFGIGAFRVEHEIKRVRDDIADETVQFNEGSSRSFSTGGQWYFAQFRSRRVADELRYRNSLVHRTYLESRTTPLVGLVVENRIKLETNEQRRTLFDDGTFQRQDRLRLLAGVHKVSYGFKGRRWRVIPQFKVLYLKKERRETAVPLGHERQLMPIVKAEYRLTERTSVKGGIQGFPLKGLKYQVRDLTDQVNSLNRQNHTFFVSNRSEYFGYDLIMNAGLAFEKIQFIDPRQRARNRKTSAMFIRVILGYKE
ncbi:MAG: hypothetical protein OXN90_19010 [Gemmatimonadota bacterium]|nr:hypothetical protein [Gemmatimonadota bacterium]